MGEGEIPVLLRPWISSYRSTPKLCIPGTDVDILYSLLSALFLTSVRLSARTLFVSFGWPAGHASTLYAAACVASFVHSTSLLPGLGAVLFSRPHIPSARLDSHPLWWQDAVHATMSFCTGYMIYDSIVGYAIETWQPGVGPVLSDEDVTYLGHHVLCSLCMLSARITGAGQSAAMVMMFTGEMTAPLMNVQLILEKSLAMGACCGGRAAWVRAAAAYVDWVFSLAYCVLRIFIGPACAAHLTYDLFSKSGRRDMPVWLSLSWMPMIWGVLVGSIPQIYACIDILKGGPERSFGDEL